MIDIEKGVTSAGSIGSNLAVSETAFKEFLAGTTPEDAAAFLKKNNISVQGIGDASAYAKTLTDAMAAGLNQQDAEILANAVSNNQTLITRDQSILQVAQQLGLTNIKP